MTLFVHLLACLFVWFVDAFRCVLLCLLVCLCVVSLFVSAFVC